MKERKFSSSIEELEFVRAELEREKKKRVSSFPKTGFPVLSKTGLSSESRYTLLSTKNSFLVEKEVGSLPFVFRIKRNIRLNFSPALRFK
ncbi:hypothetical protein LEP1GSC133_3894 [Leptospira borgpetersenii serovar Pomona str. 200901868]|uniref:Uncharacterized protein n=1 Tax=Leptospira borgpetersenii serovar Pomona str. 200901868 TaxID=1192866 RepID=M6W5Q8_LEPBO|nr:hypothetical protein LEP1GSC133_3894 [Leptospira borgpetersenii serovar Pomona str. 200901868]